MKTLRKLVSKVFASDARRHTKVAEQRAAAYSTDAALLTDRGPIRECNEDRLLAAADAASAGQAGVDWIALADGMGGHRAGEVASEMAIETARSSYKSNAMGDPSARLHEAFVAANAAVYREAATNPEHAGMGTTLVMVALTDRGAHYAWVGDSRLYHWRAGRLQQLTEDDTVVTDMLRHGLVSAEDAARHPDRCVLSQAIGVRAAVPQVHVQGPVACEIGDRLLLCSDGLHDVVPDEQISRTLGEDSALDAGSALMRLALERGTEDNVSVAVVRLAAPRSRAAQARVTATLRSL